MKALLRWINRRLRTGTAADRPMPSVSSTEYRQQAEDKQRDYELKMAKAKEQARRGNAF